jgi:hypothetical protein
MTKPFLDALLLGISKALEALFDAIEYRLAKRILRRQQASRISREFAFRIPFRIH